MKRALPIVLTLVLLAVAGYIYWSRTHTPFEATVQASLQGGMLQGTVTNSGQQTISHTVLNVTFTDASGKSLGTQTAEYESMQPGQSLQIHLSAPAGASGFSYTIESRSGGL
ncbi:MAG TPA: FxLYD domain-containing protein [Armatimonadota bacterium]|nr:FxLYD domain-containing protein [Armatimonadota bacterium]